MKKRLLITGVSGFLGRAFKDFTSRRKSYEVFGLDIAGRLSDKSDIRCDLSRTEKIAHILKDIKPDYIVHCAGARAEQQGVLLKSNFLTTQSLLGAVSNINDYSPRVGIPGSSAEYGSMSRSQKSIDETADPQPNSWYGFIKFMQTRLALFYAGQGVDAVVARIFNILGKGVPPDLCAGKFAGQIALIEKGFSKRIVNTYNLDSVRDFLDIDDVCSALLAVAKKGKCGEIYNICSGKGVSIRDLLKQMIREAKMGDIVINEKAMHCASIDVSIGSNAKLKKTASWQPKGDMQKSLKATLDHYRRTAGVS